MGPDGNRFGNSAGPPLHVRPPRRTCYGPRLWMDKGEAYSTEPDREPSASEGTLSVKAQCYIDSLNPFNLSIEEVVFYRILIHTTHTTDLPSARGIELILLGGIIPTSVTTAVMNFGGVKS